MEVNSGKKLHELRSKIVKLQMELVRMMKENPNNIEQIEKLELEIEKLK